MLWLTNLENDQIFGIFKFKTLTNVQILTILKIKHFFYFTIWKINISIFEKLLNILSIQIISKKWKNTIIKLSKNSSFVILIFATLKFRNFSRSTFRRSKFWPPPDGIANAYFNIYIYACNNRNMDSYADWDSCAVTRKIFLFCQKNEIK